MLLALPSGAIADIWDRRLIMLIAQVMMLGHLGGARGVRVYRASDAVGATHADVRPGDAAWRSTGLPGNRRSVSRSRANTSQRPSR